LYLDVVSITGKPDQPKMGGAGEVIEYAVKMLQFSRRIYLSELAECGQLNADEIDQLPILLPTFMTLSKS